MICQPELIVANLKGLGQALTDLLWYTKWHLFETRWEPLGNIL